MTDPLILGGGLAGCASALRLADHGHRTTLVAARPRLGGHAHSGDRNDCGRVEYGGGWIRADRAGMTSPATWPGLPLIPRTPIIRHSRFRDGATNGATNSATSAHGAALTQTHSNAARINHDTPAARAIHAMTLTRHFDHHAFPAKLRREILAWWAISGLGDPDMSGANERITPKLAQGLLFKLHELAHTVQGGITALAQAAATASGAAVHTGDPVERLADLGTGVQATLVTGRVITAKTAFVALPLNACRHFRFSPARTAPQQTLRTTGHAGRALKLLIRARGSEPSPKPGHLATGQAAGLRRIYADRALPDGSPLLIGFSLHDATGDPTADSVRAALTVAFPKASYLDHDWLVWHVWCADPFARGTRVLPRLTDLPAHATEHRAPRGRLAFAGSDLSSAVRGWFKAAHLTARTATAAVRRLLDPQPAESLMP